MISTLPSAPSTSPVVSPPRNWPDSFKTSVPLKTFVNKTIKAKKARLTSSSPPPDIAAEAASLAPFDASAGSAATAARVASALGWPALSGFAIYELEASPNEFVAKEWHWNQHPRNIWVDFMPRSAEHADILLVEADVNAAFDRAGVLRDAPAANKPRLQTAPPMDISDTPAKPPPPQPPKPPLVEQQEEDDGMVVDDGPNPYSEPDLSYDEILKRMSLGPKAVEKATGIKRPKKKVHPETVVATYSVEHGTKSFWTGSEGHERKEKVAWPGKRGTVRMKLRANNKFELEASTWGKAREEDPYFGAVDPPWFGPLEYGDGDASQLRVCGEMVATGTSERLKVTSCEELRNGARRPPITEDDILKCCGRSLLNGIEAHRRARKLTITIDRNADWSITLRQDCDDGWAHSDDEDVVER